MDTRNSRSRSRSPLLSRVPVILVVLLLQTNLLAAQTANPVPPERTLYSVVEKKMSFNSHFDGTTGVALTKHQTHYIVRFKEQEDFEFYIAEEFSQPSNSVFMNKGFTIYYYDEGRRFLPISNRLLMYRQALLAAERHFTQAARNAGMTLNLMYADPVRVVIGKPVADTSAAETFFQHHWICFKPEYDHKQTTPVHEYFHLVQKAAWYQNREHYFHHINLAKEPYRRFLVDMTADWAIDEPIEIPASPGYPQTNVDLSQKYLLENGGRLIREGDRAFFANLSNSIYDGSGYPPRQYQANLLIKYWSEQMAGQQDKSGAEHLLKALRRIEDLGGINQQGFFLGLTEPLPPQFDAPGEEYRWRQFFRYFCASNVIQKASFRSDPNDPIGYHDEAFQKYTFDNKIENRFHSESRVPFEKVWLQPAANEQEQLERLKTLQAGKDEIRALSHKLHLIDLDNRRSRPRNVFLYAAGEPGTDLYLLRHRSSWYSTTMRKCGSMDLLSEFTFSDQTDSESPEDFIVVNNIDQRHQGDYLWLGLVNSSTQQQNRKVQWCYLATPALMESRVPLNAGDTSTVHLVKGTSLKRWQNHLQMFADGDEFELKIQASGALHHDRADLNNLGKEDVALDLKILDSNNNEVPLEAIDGRTFKVRATPHASQPYAWNYFISGKLQSGTDYEGLCRFRIRISSPLNLGKQDEQIDESYRFQLNPLNPYLDRLEIRQGQELIYDNHQDLRRPPKEQNGAFTMNVKATFTRWMNPAKTIITAGPTAPYDQYRVEPLVWRGDDFCEGRLVIPAADVPAAGMVLRFSVSGVSKSDAGVPASPLDSDILKAGAQPDTSHFVIMGVKEYWEVTRSGTARKTLQNTHQKLLLQGNWGPIRDRTRLINRDYDYELEHGYPNGDTLDAVRSLEDIDRIIKRAKKSIEVLEKEYNAAAAPGSGLPRRVVEFRKAALQRQRQRLGLMTLRLRPMLQALVRLNGGFRYLAWDRNLSGPIAVAHHGMHVDWRFEPRGADGTNEAFLDSRLGRLLGDPLFVEDAAQVDRTRLNTDRYDTKMAVWNFWLSDLQKAQQLINLSSQLPRYVSAKEPASPDGLDSDLERDFVQLALNAQMEKIRDYLSYNLSVKLWSFYPTENEKWPFSSAIFGEGTLDETRPLWSVLPRPATGRLLRLRYGETIPVYELPFRYEKREEYFVPASDATSQPGEKTEDLGDRLMTTKWWPLNEHTAQFQKLSRVLVTNDWRDDNLGGPLPGFDDAPEGNPLPWWGDYERSIRWSVQDRNCRTQTNVYGPQANTLQILMHPESDTARATVRGVVQSWQYRQRPGEYFHLEWDTTWEIKRTGAALPPDPQEPLPDWDKSLGDPPSLELPGSSKIESPAPQTDDPESKGPAEDPKPKKPDKKPDKTDWSSIEASAFDPVTGLTTEAKKNPDGSRTITVTDSQGKVRSKKTVTKKDRERTYGSQFDPATGETTSVVGNDDGSRTITVTDRDGNVKSKRTVSEAERKRPGVSIRDPQTGQTVTSERLPDGRVRITTRDADGNEIGTARYRPEEK